MLTINLNNIKLFGYHGVYTEEQIIGGNFELNISVSIHDDEKLELLSDSINYVTIFETVKSVFSEAELLLETVGYKLIEKIYLLDSRIKSIVISIDKLNPPIPSFDGKVGISISKTF